MAKLFSILGSNAKKSFMNTAVTRISTQFKIYLFLEHLKSVMNKKIHLPASLENIVNCKKMANWLCTKKINEVSVEQGFVFQKG